MKTSKKTIYTLLCFSFILIISCFPNIPKSEFPLEVERIFNASFERTWDSVLEVVKLSNGTVITTDKSSGIIVYKVRDKKSELDIYINVYIKTGTTINKTLVYVATQYLTEVEKDFFEKLRGTIGDT